MKWLFLKLCLFAVFPQVLLAAEIDNSKLDIVEEPICFLLRNEAAFSVNGYFATDQYQRPDGVITRHRSNFRFNEAGETDAETGDPLDRAEFCSYGPFLPDRQLLLTLRTLFPVFECKTRVDTGQEIVIKGERRADGNGVQIWAECVRVDGTKTAQPPLR